MTRSFQRNAKQQQRRRRATAGVRAKRDELKVLRRKAAEKLRAEIAHDSIDDLSGDWLLERFEPMPCGLDQLGDLPLPEQHLPWWVDVS